MHFTLPAIYPITDTHISGISHYEQVRRLIRGGARLIQLREKGVPAGDWFADAQAALNLARQHGVKVLINDRVDIALALGADGVHIGQDDLPPEAARRLLGNEAVIGYSTHTLRQIQEATELPIDYIAFGPIFSTNTKNDPDPTVGLDLLEQVSRVKSDLSLVAIGGISPKNIRSVYTAGADSAAMIDALISQPSLIESRLRELIRLSDDSC